MTHDEEEISVMVSVTNKNNRFQFRISTSIEIPTYFIRSVLAGGVALTIKAEDGPENQGRAMTEVIDYLNHEFISTDSFENPEFIFPNIDPHSEEDPIS